MGKYFAVAKDTFKEFGQDKAPRLGAALAYYTIFSIGPLLLIAIAIAGFVFGQEAAQGRISGELSKVFGAEMAKAMEEMVKAADKEKAGIIATIIGVVTLFFGASGVFGQLKDALNTIWNVEPKKAGGIMGFVKERFLSMSMVLGIGFLLLVALVFDAAIAAMGHRFEQYVGGEPLMQAIQLVISFALITVLFAAIFRILPDLDIAWRDVWVGAALTSLLFVIGKFALGLYLGKAAVGSSYGAAGSLVVLLVWVYWSAQILFLGAEFTQVYARSYGSLQGDTSKRDARAQGVRVEDRPKAQTPRPSGSKEDKRDKPDLLHDPIVPAFEKSLPDELEPTRVVSGRSNPPSLVPTHSDAAHAVTGRGHAKPGHAAAKQAASKPKAKGGFVKLAAGGAAGMFFGTLLGGLGTFLMVLKTIKKLIPFR